MAEVTNHMVTEKISHILKNQSKSFAYLSQLKFSSRKVSGHNTVHQMILILVLLLICLFHIGRHLNIFYMTKQNQSIRHKAKHNKIKVMRQSLSLRTKGLSSNHSWHLININRIKFIWNWNCTTIISCDLTGQHLSKVYILISNDSSKFPYFLLILKINFY